MSDLITLVGTIVDHEGATPLEGARITATPSQRVTQTSDGEEALSDASATTDETGAFSLALVYAEGLRYTIVYRSGGERLMRGVLDCDSYAAGATVDVADLPPIAGVPPSAVETLQAWFLAQLEALGEGGAVVSVNGQGGIVVLDAADVGSATSAQGSLADTAVQPADLSPYATDADLTAHASDTTSVHGIADTSALVVTTDARLSDARTPTAHTHTAADLDATGATDGHVLTADGAGGAAWEAPADGGSGFPVQQVTLTDDATVSTTGWPTDQIVTVVYTQDSSGGHTVSHGATLASGVTWSPGSLPGSETVTTWRYSAILGWIVEGCWISVAGSASPDTTDPTPGTLSSSAIDASGFTLTVTGATDVGGLHAQPYRFSTDNGSTWSAWQTSEHYNATGLDDSTEYTCVHQVRDAALNDATGTPITVETLTPDPENEPPEWTATFTMGTPLPTSVTATASAMATDDTAVTGYQVSYNGGSSWASITPSGSVFTLAGTASTTYSTTQLRAVDGDGAYSDPLNVPEYTLAAETTEVALTYRSSHVSTSGSMAATGVNIGTAPGGGDTRSVFVLALFNNTTADAVAPTTCTIGGVTATRDGHGNGSAANPPSWALFRAEVPTGSTADVSVTGFTGGAPNTRAFHVWTADAAVALTDDDTALWSAEGTTTTVATVDGGFVIAAATGGFGAAGQSWSANVTSRYAVANHAAADGATTGGSIDVSLPIYRPFIVTASYGSV